MFRIYLVVFVLAVNTQANKNGGAYLHLGVYYESRCPDSKDFVVEQLQPTLELLHEYIVVEFVPFGKAHSINGTKFKCQHGPKECMGNLVQACTISLMEEDKVNDKDITKYVACELNTEAGTRKDWQCVKQTNVDLALVKKCVSSKKGIELQLRNERKTKMVKPAFVPSVTFDRHFDQEKQDSAMDDLTKTVCEYWAYSLIPCRHRYHKSVRSQKEEQLDDETADEEE